MAAPRTTPPAEIDWSRLSPRALETVALVTMRLAAGLSHDEVARILDAERPVLRHHEQPREFTRAWVAARTKELKREIEQSGASQY